MLSIGVKKDFNHEQEVNEFLFDELEIEEEKLNYESFIAGSSPQSSSFVKDVRSNSRLNIPKSATLVTSKDNKYQLPNFAKKTCIEENGNEAVPESSS